MEQSLSNKEMDLKGPIKLKKFKTLFDDAIPLLKPNGK